MSLSDDEMNKAERLAVAAQVAPTLRAASGKTRVRRVARVDADGKVVGYTTIAEVQKSLLAAKAIEIEVVDGVRPKEVMCLGCGLPFSPTNKVGKVATRCRDCMRGQCDLCGEPVSRSAMWPATIKLRNGAPPKCKRCTAKCASVLGAQARRVIREPISCLCGKPLRPRKSRTTSAPPMCVACFNKSRSVPKGTP